MMLWMLRRVSAISRATGVPRIGKNRIRGSGGGSTLMYLLRSLSFSLVVAARRVCQDGWALGGRIDIEGLRVRVVERGGREMTKPPGLSAGCSGVLVRVVRVRVELWTAGGARDPK